MLYISQLECCECQTITFSYSFQLSKLHVLFSVCHFLLTSFIRSFQSLHLFVCQQHLCLVQWGEFSDTDLDQKDALFLHFFSHKISIFSGFTVFLELISKLPQQEKGNYLYPLTMYISWPFILGCLAKLLSKINLQVQCLRQVV